MWMLPTRGRPHLAQRVFSIAPPTTKGIVIIDSDEVGDYAGLELPEGWARLILPRRFISQKLNACFKAFPDEPWYGAICDDQLPMTQGWDTELPKSAGSWGIAWADDGLNNRIGAAAYGGELIRALGWFSCPALKHFYIDDAHELIANELGIGHRRSNIKIPHLHFTTGKAPHDRTYAERPSNANDRRAFEDWRENEWPAIRDRLKMCLPSHVSCVPGETTTLNMSQSSGLA